MLITYPNRGVCNKFLFYVLPCTVQLCWVIHEYNFGGGVSHTSTPRSHWSGEYRREGGSCGKTPCPGLKGGSWIFYYCKITSLLVRYVLILILEALSVPTQGPALFIAPEPELALDRPGSGHGFNSCHAYSSKINECLNDGCNPQFPINNSNRVVFLNVPTRSTICWLGARGHVFLEKTFYGVLKQ